jgi:hypothetical protein
MRKLIAVLLIVSMIAMMLPGISSSPIAPETGAAIESGNLNPSGLYVIDCGMDATIVSSFPNTNYGTGNFDAVGSGYNALMQFNTSSLPDHLDIQSAILKFEIESTEIWNWSGVNRSEQVILDIDRITSTWDEGVVTWNLKPTEGGPEYYFGIKRVSPWTYENDSAPFQWQLIWISVDITYLVEHWYSGAYDNYGLMFYPDSYCNYTKANIYSRHVFNSPPRLEITATSILSVCHLAYYDSYKGLGIDPTEFNISTSINGSAYHRSTQDICGAIIGQNLSVSVRDYFGREIKNQTTMISSSETFIDIGIPVRSWKFYNMGDFFCKIFIWYNISVPPYTEYISPRWTSDFYLIDGTYRFAMTQYLNGTITGSTQTWVRGVYQAGFTMIDGSSISEVLTTAEGTLATSRVITSLLTPSLITMGYDLPMVPAMIPWVNRSSTMPCSIVVSFQTLQVKSSLGFVWMNQTGPDPFTLTTRTVLSDTFYFVGAPTTAIMINNTGTGITEYNSSTLPSAISLNGSDYTVWTSGNVSVSRSLLIRYSQAFSYNFYPSGHPLGSKAFVANIVFGNPASSEAIWRGIDLFIPREPSSSWDNRSLRVFDINNSIALNEGAQYAVSANGVYMFFSSLGNGSFRGFQISYTASNDSRFLEVPNVIVTQVGDGNTLTVQWQSMLWYYCDVSWRNDFRETYTGPLRFSLNTNPAMDPFQEVIVLTSTGATVDTAIVSENTIVIPSITLNPGESVSYRILFRSAAGESGSAEWGFNGIPAWMIVSIVAVMAFFIACFLKFAVGGTRANSEGNVALSVSIVCLLIDFLLVVSSFVL